jgi:hypothetical protein
MRTYVEVLVEIPCFKCLFWNPIKDSHLHCNPNECQQLTDWLLKQVENEKQEDSLILVDAKTENSVKCAKKRI